MFGVTERLIGGKRRYETIIHSIVGLFEAPCVSATLGCAAGFLRMHGGCIVAAWENKRRWKWVQKLVLQCWLSGAKKLEAERAQQNKIIDTYRESDREQKEKTERHNDFRRYVLEYLNEHWFSILREIRAEHTRLTALGIKRIWICPGPDSQTTDDDQMSAAVFELFRNIPRPLKESLPIYIQTTKEFLQQKATAQHSSCPFLRLGMDDAGGLYAFWD